MDISLNSRDYRALRITQPEVEGFALVIHMEGDVFAFAVYGKDFTPAYATAAKGRAGLNELHKSVAGLAPDEDGEIEILQLIEYCAGALLLHVVGASDDYQRENQ